MTIEMSNYLPINFFTVQTYFITVQTYFITVQTYFITVQTPDCMKGMGGKYDPTL